MAQTTASPPPATEAIPFLTPLNLFLVISFITLIYLRFFRPPSPAVLPPAPTPVVYRVFTPPQLVPFNGQDDKPIYFGVRHVERGAKPSSTDSLRVYNVTSGRNFYGPGGPYANFAGRDASRGLACGSFDEDMLTKDLEGPLDTLDDLGEEEIEALRGWEERFDEKYLVVGELVALGSEKAKKAEEAPKA